MNLIRKFGHTGTSQAAIGLGCMGMSEFYGETDDAQSLAVLHRAMELGVTLFDTADMYGDGHNEVLLGRFLKEVTGTPFIATKFGIRRDKEDGTQAYQRVIDNSPSYIRTACEASLKRLGVEAIDLYYMHRYSPDYALEEAIGTLSRLVEEGKVKAIGLSEVSADTLRRAHAIHPVSAVQTEYSLQTRDVEAEVLPACLELGIALVAYSPLGRGMLSGQITSREALAEDDFRRLSPRFKENALKQNVARLDVLKSMAAAHEANPAQIALAWVLHQGEGVFAIPGTKRVSYLEANVAAAEIALTADDLARLDQAFAPGTVQGARYPEAGLKTVNT
ncbi:MAG: aldo/keto reductase [Alphaproteobacteria bacterium]|nr:aldo/keto reductase [Alphaproteobacteria bacterium]|tara:strand:- start:3254 stop:4255 length:1002 start_codon:yes stop_codon:yes gene_type:complete